MGSVRSDVTSHAPVSETPTSALARHITAYVLLAGILGGLLLVLLVLCFCKLCFKPSKQLTRQPVLFTKYPSERQGASGRGSRKYKSLDPSVTVDLETSCGYSENSASPGDQEEGKIVDSEVNPRSPPQVGAEFPWFHGEAHRGILDMRLTEDSVHGEPSLFSPRQRSPVDDKSSSLAKYRRSPPFRRQTSFCIDSDERLDQISPSPSGESILVIEEEIKPMPSKSNKISAEIHLTPHDNSGTSKDDADEQELIGAVGGTAIKVVVAEYRPSVPLMDLDSPPDDTQAYHLRGAPLLPPRVTLLRPSSPLAVVPELEAWEEEEPPSISTKDESSLQRTASTESGALETILEERRRQLVRQDAGDDEEDGEPRAKVRYNDTGSLEEVDDEVLDAYVDEESDLSIEEVEAAMMREQYRKLWRLRATFEEEIEEATPEVGKSEDEAVLLPEVSISIEDATDADGREEILIKDEEEGMTIEIQLKSPTEKVDKMEDIAENEEVQQYLTITERRDNYKSILSKRLQKRKGPGLTPGSSADDSFSSVDTEKSSSTDASRLEVATTSLDSTTDTTDSPGDGQASRLQQMKADSGYKSLENATSNGSSNQKAPKLSRKQIHFVLNGSGSESLFAGGSSAEKDEGVSVDFETSIEDSIDQEKKKTIISSVALSSGGSSVTSIKSFPSLSRTPTQGSMGDLESPTADESSLFSGTSCKSSVFQRFFRQSPTSTTERRHHPMLTRDFSVDEKSDALFREFSRLDPAYDTIGPVQERARSPRLHPRTNRLHRRHTVDAGDGCVVVPPRTTRRKMSAQENIEEEMIRLERLRMQEEIPRAVNIPVIQVAEEDTV